MFGPVCCQNKLKDGGTEQMPRDLPASGPNHHPQAIFCNCSELQELATTIAQPRIRTFWPSALASLFRFVIAGRRTFPLAVNIFADRSAVNIFADRSAVNIFADRSEGWFLSAPPRGGRRSRSARLRRDAHASACRND